MSKKMRFWVGKFFLILLASFLLTSIAAAEKRTFSVVGEYTMSDYETPAAAEQMAIAYAKQRATEQASVYVETYTKSEGMSVTVDKIYSMTSSALTVIEQKTSKQPLANGDVHIRAELTVEVDTESLEDMLRLQREQLEQMTQRYLEHQKVNAQEKIRIATLKQKIAEMEKKSISTQELRAEIKVKELEFLSNQKMEETLGYYQRGEFAQVLALCNEAMQLNPKNAEAYVVRGDVYANMVRNGTYDMEDGYGKAIADFERAIEIDSKNRYAYNNRGAIYFDKTEYDKAIMDYNRALQIDPRYADAYYNRGTAYILVGKDDLAIMDLNRALELNPEYEKACNNCGILCSRKGEYRKAIAYFNRALEINPQFASVYVNRGIAYVQQGELKQALTDFENALRIDSTNQKAKQLRQQILDVMQRR